MSVQRHKDRGHIARDAARAQEAAEVSRADELLDRARRLEGKAISLLNQAEAAGDLRTALTGIREARGCLEFRAKLMGEINDQPNINILIAPQWVIVRQALMDALQPYPSARAEAARALMQVESRLQ